MNRHHGYPNLVGRFGSLLGRRPQAWANVTGSDAYPEIRGQVRFYQTAYGVLTVAELAGLPDPGGDCDSPIFAFHIHEGDRCTGNPAEGGSDPFSNARTHDDPYDCPHPYHAGDLPPLFGAGGYAFSACLTDRFAVDDILGKTVIVHASPDDFTTQPSGNAGVKMACGEIRGLRSSK